MSNSDSNERTIFEVQPFGRNYNIVKTETDQLCVDEEGSTIVCKSEEEAQAIIDEWMSDPSTRPVIRRRPVLISTSAFDDTLVTTVVADDSTIWRLMTWNGASGQEWIQLPSLPVAERN